MIFSRILACLLLAALMPSISLAQESQSTPGSLTLNPGRVAVKGIGHVGLESESFTSSQMQTWPIDDWVLIDLPAAVDATGDDHVRAWVDQVSRVHADSFVSPVFRGSDGGPVIVTPVLLVSFDAGHRGDIARQVIASFPRLQVLSEDWASMPGAYKLSVDCDNGYEVLELAEALEGTQGVRYAEPDWIFTGRGNFTPNDPLFIDQWGLNNTGQDGGVADMDINAPEAWDITRGDPAIKVLVIDTGVQQDHPDINQMAGVDLTSEGPGTGGPVNAFDRHGTPVAGCLTARTDNAQGIAGIAADCESVSARTFISINTAGNWTAQSSWTVDALTHAENIGVRVTNNSNYYGIRSSAIDDKYAYTRDAGMVHFASAGNTASSNVTYPASLPEVLAIGSIRRTGALSSFSNFGLEVYMTAPGSMVLSTDRTGTDGYGSGDYTTVQGTSFASPYCAGIAALVLSINPNLNSEQVELVMRKNSKDLGTVGFDTSFGWGLADAYSSLLAADPCVLQGVFCTSQPNSTGQSATITSSGTVSISVNDLVLVAEGCPSSVIGLFFYGPDEVALPLGDGIRCAGGGLKRLAPQLTNGEGSVSNSLDLTAPPFDSGSGQAIVASTKIFQFWFRDQAGVNGSNLSNALLVTFCN